MDTLTHIVLGACIGEAIAGKQLGKKALLLGAVAQSIPDIDFIASFWLPTSTDLLAHRGFTHSFLFMLLVTPLLAFVSRKWVSRSSNMSMNTWMLLWGLEILVHLVLDSFNAYGTGWFEPFSHYRVSFNTMYVADPLFSIWPAAACVALLILKMKNARRAIWVKAGLGLCSLYLVLGIVFKTYVDSTVQKELRARNIAFDGYFSTPTLLNNMLWYFVARNDSGYYTGYRSIFDKGDVTRLHYVYRNDSLLKLAADKEDINRLKRFSQGFYTADLWHDTAVFNVMRFGEINGWNTPEPKFTLYYFLQYPDNNGLIVQRGRVASWDKHMMRLFLKRIVGTAHSLPPFGKNSGQAGEVK
jgi:inner membrane protein